LNRNQCQWSLKRSRHGAATWLLLLIPLSGCSKYVAREGSSIGQVPLESLTVSPQGVCVRPSGTQQFVANLRNVAGVDWYVDSVKGGNNASGTISADGLYGAPSTAGSHTVEAISQSDATVSATATVKVTTSPRFAITPASATVPIAGQQSFEGQTCGVPNPNVAWTVDDLPGGSETVGSISSDGTYTAPATTGTHKVKGTDSALNQSSEAVVTVASGIVVDFGSRTNKQFPIPVGILGVNHVDWLPTPGDKSLISQAGFTLSRSYAEIPTVYESKKPSWEKIDGEIAELKAAGFHVLLQLSMTPKWLQPQPNSCKSESTKAPPRDPATWGQLAKSYVAHMDAKFPGVVTDYEIWNEPDTGGMCGTSDRLKTYLAIYAAAAPLMKQQAAADGATIRVGGPATSGLNDTWLQALLSNSATAPNVDFVSYHNYIGGKDDVDAMWDAYHGDTPLYQLTQDSATGAAALYARASRLVAAGKQPLGAATPIYVDEFNTNWAFLKECCRNDPTYSPVWNALYVSDLLDTVYSGTTHVPGQLTYYAATNHPYFCLVGELNKDMDCTLLPKSTNVPYPQYYVYQLMASQDYLGMNSGGYMAASISPVASGAGLVITAFYTAKQDSILIVNPTGKTYSEIVSAQNTGISSPAATLYQVVNGHSISSTPLALTQSGTDYNATVSIPPYAVLGISIR